MKINIMQVQSEDKNLRVSLGRDDWLATPEGVRATRILRLYGSHELWADGPDILVAGAADNDEINTVQACQSVMDKWANMPMTFRFDRGVTSPRRRLENMEEVQEALDARLKVQACLGILFALPVLYRDFTVLTQAGYRNLSVSCGLHACSLRLPVNQHVNPWKMLSKLQQDIACLIK